MIEIKTIFIHPPIPMRNFDWRAHVVGDEEGRAGYGPTEQEAIDDLQEQLEASK